MTESSIFWGGTTIGDHGNYDDDTFSDFLRKVFTVDRTTQGIIQDYLNELAVTNPSGATIRVATGGAIVDGKPYENTANVDFTVSAPGGGLNYYTVILRKDFSAQTVRLDMLGPSAVAFPTMTQTDGTVWEISLANVSITSGGVVALTPTGQLCVFASEPSDGSITHAKLANDAVETHNVKDANITAIKLATDAVETAKIKDANVTVSKLAAGIFPYSADGDLAYRSAANTLTALAKGLAKQELRMNAGATAPEWAFPGLPFVVAVMADAGTITAGNNATRGFAENKDYYNLMAGGDIVIPASMSGVWLKIVTFRMDVVSGPPTSGAMTVTVDGGTSQYVYSSEVAAAVPRTLTFVSFELIGAGGATYTPSVYVGNGYNKSIQYNDCSLFLVRLG
jgi:hypothetical protein